MNTQAIDVTPMQRQGKESEQWGTPTADDSDVSSRRQRPLGTDVRGGGSTELTLLRSGDAASRQGDEWQDGTRKHPSGASRRLALRDGVLRLHDASPHVPRAFFLRLRELHGATDHAGMSSGYRRYHVCRADRMLARRLFAMR